MTTKSDIASRVAEEVGLTKVQAASAVNSFIDAIGDSLAEGKRVQIAGLGIFTPKETKARIGRNPKTGDPVQISAGRKVSFKMAVDLRGRI
jgi:DNA-binding protein HU-beta